MIGRHAAIREHFLHQARACDDLGSPFTARLCGALSATLDTSTAAGRRALDWPGDPRADALALRLCGGLHALVLSEADAALMAVYPPAQTDEPALARSLPGALERNDVKLLASLDSAPQTNEIGRSGMLLPGFLAIARETRLPLALHEIGASAGLNMLFDRFSYRYGDRVWGDAASPVQLQPDIRDACPPLDGHIEILSRRGCDIAPVDVTDAAARLRLRSYVWADQAARLARLEAAMNLEAETPVSVERSDAAGFVRRALETRQPGSVFALFHSIMWQYMPEASRAAIETELSKAGAGADARSPIAWLRMEPLDTKDPHATLSLTLWPDGHTRRLAACDYHGRWIAWWGE